MTEIREYTVVTSDGEVVRHGKAEVLPEPPQGCLRLIGVLPPNAPSYWDGEVFILKPPPPSAHHIFDYTTKQWVDPRTEQTQWPVVRSQRNALLSASDWTQLPDVPLATKETWAIYRQALREITEQTDPFNINWPVRPDRQS